MKLSDIAFTLHLGRIKDTNQILLQKIAIIFNEKLFVDVSDNVLQGNIICNGEGVQPFYFLIKSDP